MAKQHFPEPAVGALIFNPQKKIFLMKSSKWGDRYVIPGGHVELGESLESALKREVREETGLVINGVKFLQFQEIIYNEEFWKRRHFIFFDYICNTNRAAVALNSEGQEYTWVSVKEALKLPLGSATRTSLKKYLNK